MTGDSWVDGCLVGFDLETTGLDREVEEPISFAFAAFEGREPHDTREAWLEPTRAISAGASAVHGLTRSRLAELGALRHDDGVREIEARLRALGVAGHPIVGANLAFDLTIVDRTLGRLAPTASLAAAGWSGPALDVLVIDRALDRDFATRPVRRLAALCQHYGLEARLHTAAGDASASVQVLLAQAERYPELGEMTLDELFKHQAEWHRAWTAELSARAVAGGHRPLDVGEGAWPYLERATRF